MTDANWIPIWRGLSVTLLREGFCSMKSVERWAKDNNWRLRSVSDVIKALAIESFEHEGDVYFRFSGKVVPLVPRDVKDVSIYRQAAAPSENAA